MTTFLMFLCLIALIIVGVLANVTITKIGTIIKLLREENHSQCTAGLEARTEAAYLRAAAERWDSVDSRPRQTHLANTRYEVGGPSMPAIWLRDEADRLEGKQVL